MEKSFQHYLFNFIAFFSFFLIFLSFLFRSTFLCKRTTVKLMVPPQLRTSFTPTAGPLSQLLAPPLPQLLHRCYRNFFVAAATTPTSFFVSSHRNCLHDHHYNSVYHYFHSAHFSSAITTVASYTTNFIKFIANRRSVLSF